MYMNIIIIWIVYIYEYYNDVIVHGYEYIRMLIGCVYEYDNMHTVHIWIYNDMYTVCILILWWDYYLDMNTYHHADEADLLWAPADWFCADRSNSDHSLKQRKNKGKGFSVGM